MTEFPVDGWWRFDRSHRATRMCSVASRPSEDTATTTEKTSKLVLYTCKSRCVHLALLWNKMLSFLESPSSFRDFGSTIEGRGWTDDDV